MSSKKRAYHSKHIFQILVEHYVKEVQFLAHLEVPFIGYRGSLPTFVPIHTRSTLVYEERELLYYV